MGMFLSVDWWKHLPWNSGSPLLASTRPRSDWCSDTEISDELPNLRLEYPHWLKRLLLPNSVSTSLSFCGSTWLEGFVFDAAFDVVLFLTACNVWSWGDGAKMQSILTSLNRTSDWPIVATMWSTWIRWLCIEAVASGEISSQGLFATWLRTVSTTLSKSADVRWAVNRRKSQMHLRCTYHSPISIRRMNHASRCFLAEHSLTAERMQFLTSSITFHRKK